MGIVIQGNFRNHREKLAFSADVYSEDMEKYQFQTVALSILDAYQDFVNEAAFYGVNFIKCIAIYTDTIPERKRIQAPEKVWQYQADINGLAES